MSDAFPFEQALAAHYDRFEPLFRAPAGLVARAHARIGHVLLRVVVADDDAQAASVEAALAGWRTRSDARRQHPAVLLPATCSRPLKAPHHNVIVIEYATRGVPTTLANRLVSGAPLPARRLLGQLVPALEALERLHDDGNVHGAIAATAFAIDHIAPDGDTDQADDPALLVVRLCDIGLESALRPLDPRAVLGAGASSRRNTETTATSDVRAVGHLLTWLHGLAHARRGALAASAETWPADLIDLAQRAARKRPIRTTTLVSELKRIIAQWDALPPGEGPPGADVTPLKPATGAMRGTLVAPAPRDSGFTRNHTHPLHLRPDALQRPTAAAATSALDLDAGWDLASGELDVVELQDLASATLAESDTPAATEGGDEPGEATAGEQGSDATASEQDHESAAGAEGAEPSAAPAATDEPRGQPGEEDSPQAAAEPAAGLEAADNDALEPASAFELDASELESPTRDTEPLDTASDDPAEPEAPDSDGEDDEQPPPAPSEAPDAPTSVTGRRRALPDVTAYGYTLSSVLGFNAAAEHVTYRGRRADDALEIVAKRLTHVEPERVARRLEQLTDVDHPRIAAFVGSFVEDDRHTWLVQRFVDRPSVASRTRWSAQALRTFADSALELLVHLASLDPPLVHGDVKPENLLVDDEGRAILVDVGYIPEALSEDAPSEARGSAGFAAPEQLDARPLTGASDLYGLAATLVSMVAGLPGYRIHELIDDDAEGGPSFDLSCLPAGASDELRAWLGQLLEPDPERRFRTALAARNAFAGIELGDFDGAPEAAPLVDPYATQPLNPELLRESAAPLYPERSVDPRGKVERIEHTLRPDVLIPEPEVQRSNRPLVVAAIVLTVLLVIGLIVMRLVASPPSSPPPEALEGAPRALIDFAATLPPTADAVHPAAGLLAVCNDLHGTVLHTASAEPVHRFWPDAGGCRALAFTPDGTRLLVAGQDSVLRRHDLRNPDTPVEQVGMAIEGQIDALVALSADRVLLRERHDGAQARWRVLDASAPDHVVSLALPADAIPCDGAGRDAVGYAVGQQIELFDPARLTPLRTLEARGRVQGCALSPEGLRAAAVVEGFGVQHWRMSSGTSGERPVVDWRDLDRARSPVALRFGASADTLLIAFNDVVLVAATAFEALDFSGRVEGFSTVAGDRLLAASAPGRVLIGTRQGVAVADLLDGVTLPLTETRYVHRAGAFTADGQTLITVHTPRRGAGVHGDELQAAALLSSWDLSRAALRWSVRLTFEPYALNLDPTGNLALLAERQGTHHELHTLSLADGSYGERVQLPGRLTGIDWAHDGQIAVARCGAAGSRVFFRDGNELTPMNELGPESTVAVWRDKRLLQWSAREGLRAFALGTEGRSPPLVRPSAIDGAIHHIATHAFGQIAVLYGPGGAYWVELNERRAVRIADTAVSHVAFSADGTRFVADGHVFMAEQGEPLVALEAFDPSDRLSFAADGTRLVALPRADREGAIWDAATGARLTALPRTPTDDVSHVELLPPAATLHPSAALMLRDRAGVGTVDTLDTVSSQLVIGLDGPHRWALASDSRATGSAAGAPLRTSNGFAPHDGAETVVSSAELAADLQSLALRATPLVDPLAGQPLFALPRYVTLQVDSRPQGARVTLESEGEPPRFLGRTPLEVEVESYRPDARATLVLESQGYAAARTPLALSGDVTLFRELLDARTAAEAASMVVEGPLAAHDFAVAVQRRRHAVRLCGYLDSLDFGMGSTARALTAKLRIVIGADGVVRQVGVEDGSVSEDVRRCLESEMRTWRFERAPTGSIVNYSLDLGR